MYFILIVNKQQFKKEANKYCLKTLGFECFEESDPYEVEDFFHDCWKNISPKEFVEVVFEENFNDLEYNEFLKEESDIYYDDLDEEFEQNS